MTTFFFFFRHLVWRQWNELTVLKYLPRMWRYMKRSPGPSLHENTLPSWAVLCNHKMETKTKEELLESLCFAKSVCMCVMEWGSGRRQRWRWLIICGESAECTNLFDSVFDQGGQSRLQRFIQAISGNPRNPEANMGILSQRGCIFLRNVGLHLGMMWSDVGKDILGKGSRTRR